MDEDVRDRDRLAALRRRLVDGSLPPPSGLVVPDEARLYAEGTTVPLLARPLAQTATGLFVPATAVAETYPLDLMGVYLTGEDVFGQRVPLDAVRLRLESVPRQAGIAFCAHLMRRLDSIGGEPDLDSVLIDEWFLPYARPRVRALLADESGRRRLLAGQGVLALLKRVLAWCTDSDTPTVDPSLLVSSYFMLLDHLPGADDDPDAELTESRQVELAADITSNQWFYAERDPVWLMFRHRRRWHDGGIDPSPRAMFQTSTGLTMDAAERVVLALWAIAQSGSLFVKPEGVVAALPIDEVERVMHHLARSADEFKQLIDAEEGAEAPAWEFSMFERFPLLRIGGGYLVISPSLLLRRVFSWTSAWDVLSDTRNNTVAVHGRFKSLLGKRAEQVVREQFAAIYPDIPSKRVYDEDDQKHAYARGGQIPKRADLVVDCSDAWLVVEVTSSMPRRDTITASRSDAHLWDIEKLVDEVRQIDSSIALLRTDETALTGYAARPRTFLPVLVCTEGFPVNPMTISALMDAIAREDLLIGNDIESLRVLTGDDLLIAEAVIESSGQSLIELLRQHASSGLQRADLRSFIIDTRRATRLRPSRIDGTLTETLQPLFDAVGEDDSSR